jgi:hypothetical protein
MGSSPRVMFGSMNSMHGNVAIAVTTQRFPRRATVLETPSRAAIFDSPSRTF